jgi:hypothetical protein
MKNITIEEAVNGFMLTIIWDDERMIKEIYEQKLEVLERLKRWLDDKRSDERSKIGLSVI